MTYYKHGRPIDPAKIARVAPKDDAPPNSSTERKAPAPHRPARVQHGHDDATIPERRLTRQSGGDHDAPTHDPDPYAYLPRYKGRPVADEPTARRSAPEPSAGGGAGSKTPPPRVPSDARRRRFRRRRIILGIAVVVVVALIGSGIFVFSQLQQLNSGLHRSDLAAVAGVPQNTSGTNILVMGLDSRLDEDGNPLPADVYNALHAGTADDGGYNTNVLIYIHIPDGGGHPVGISIPRDDWVALPGSPDGESYGKIKQAYGLQLDQTLTHLVQTQPTLSHAEAYQQARAAARQEEVATVSQFLHQPIDHFVEVTMGAFYQLAEAVQPIEVCLNEATADSYSGANFVKGYQELSAAQAVAFVRQRRDTTSSSVNLTDLDRERRQQAFIISLANKLKSENLFAKFGVMEKMLGAVKSDIAVDKGLDLLSFASDAQRFGGGGVSFETLPIDSFGVEDGQDVNLVDLATVRSTAAQLIAAADAAAKSTPSSTAHASAGSSKSGSGTSSNASTKPGATPAPSDSFGTNGVMSSSSIPCVN
ncbi:LCP family glycopolymer transferase [Humibacter ginsenosidimutans]|uniref:LCP family glycopolymer transferase n=1 Tax=Humibacter ginsenosidimutans TaxID=2599293 RepID=UPI001FF07D0D|nr:LCP family protein [Humibacter ginsenosidimutans]